MDIKKKLEKLIYLKKKLRKLKKRTCRICYERGLKKNKLYYPCKCKGSLKYIHEKCLKKWISISNKKKCPQCKYRYIIEETNPLAYINNPYILLIITVIINIFLILISGISFYKIIGCKHYKFFSIQFISNSIEIFGLYSIISCFILMIYDDNFINIFDRENNLHFKNILIISFKLLKTLIENLIKKIIEKNSNEKIRNYKQENKHLKY